MSFESELDDLFNKSIDLDDTIWNDESETLRDAIMRIYADERTKECQSCENNGKQAYEFAEKGDLKL